MTKKYAFLGRLALFGTALIWGTSFVMLKSALNDMGTLWILAVRFSFAAAFFLLIANKKLKNMSPHLVKGSVMMGACLAAAYIVQTYGLVYTTPGKNAFLSAAYCVMVPFLAWAVYKRKPDFQKIAAAVICFAGIGFVSLENGFSNVNIGDILTVCCCVFYALQIVMMEQYIGEGDSVSVSGIEFLSGAVICWILALIFEPAPVDVPASSWLSIAYMGIVCTGLAFFLQAWGMRYTPSSTASMLMTLEAVFGALFSVILYHENISVKLIIGFILIFAAVLLSELGPELTVKIKRYFSGRMVGDSSGYENKETGKA
ncbi:MAG: DMT family transporter [Candidatus Limivicinus sp.]|jgi:drug/metabolite transporter (DMT)-like permease